MNRLRLPLQVISTVMVLFLFLFTESCHLFNDDDSDDGGIIWVEPPADSPRDITVDEINVYMFNYDEFGLNNFTYNASDIFEIVYANSKISQIKLPGTEGTYDYEYDSDLLKEYTYNQDAFKLSTRLTYNGTVVSKLENYIAEKQADGSYPEELTAAWENIVISDAGIQTAMFTSYVGGVEYAKYEVVFTCNDKENNIGKFIPWWTMQEFTDYANGITRLSPRHVTKIELKDVDTEMISAYNFNYTFDADDNVTSLDIDTPFSVSASYDFGW